MDDLQVLQNKAVHIILDLPPRTSSCDVQAKLHWKPLQCIAQKSWAEAPFLFINQLITFFLVPLHSVLIVIFTIMIPNLGTILGKPQPKEGGAIGPVSTLLQMSDIRLIYQLGKPLLYPVLNKTCPKWLLKYLLISKY